MRYYKIQWSESWASEELLALKYGDLISAYWKEYDDSHKCPIEEQLQEVAADPVFIGSLLTKMVCFRDLLLEKTCSALPFFL